MKPSATCEQSEKFLKKVIGKTLEQASFMSNHQPYECYVADAQNNLSLTYDTSRILVIIKNNIIVSGSVG